MKARFGIESTRRMRDVENIHRDYGIERDKVQDYGNPTGDLGTSLREHPVFSAQVSSLTRRGREATTGDTTAVRRLTTG